jgi:hypothetical protein
MRRLNRTELDSVVLFGLTIIPMAYFAGGGCWRWFAI